MTYPLCLGNSTFLALDSYVTPDPKKEIGIQKNKETPFGQGVSAI
jgi:hypothetical protein